MADASWLRQSDVGNIRHLVLDAAPVNALRPDRLFGLAETIEKAGADETVRAIVISSAQNVFSAGLDLKAAADFAASPSGACASVKMQIRAHTIEGVKTQMKHARGNWFSAETRDAMSAMLER